MPCLPSPINREVIELIPIPIPRAMLIKIMYTGTMKPMAANWFVPSRLINQVSTKPSVIMAMTPRIMVPVRRASNGPVGSEVILRVRSVDLALIWLFPVTLHP